MAKRKGPYFTRRDYGGKWKVVRIGDGVTRDVATGLDYSTAHARTKSNNISEQGRRLIGEWLRRSNPAIKMRKGTPKHTGFPTDRWVNVEKVKLSRNGTLKQVVIRDSQMPGSLKKAIARKKK